MPRPAASCLYRELPRARVATSVGRVTVPVRQRTYINHLNTQRYIERSRQTKTPSFYLHHLDTMPDSKYKIIKDGWGSRVNFQASYGLKMTPEDIETGNAILEEMMRMQALEEKEKKEKSKYLNSYYLLA